MTVTTDEKFAIVGIGGMFPGAHNAEEYFQNILEQRVFIERLPADSAEREIFFRPEALKLANKGDRSYTDLLATIPALDFDGGQFRIPPTVAERMDDNQKVSLLVAKEALSYGGLNSVSRDRVSVFMGNTMLGLKHHEYVARFDCDKYEHYLSRQPLFVESLSPEQQRQVLAAVRKQIVGQTLGVTEDTAPGLLPNLVAARINAVFDLHGHAYVIDAACASGLAAIICGIQQLQLGQADAVICGAADIQNRELGRIYFCGLGALSPDGSFPFDERANGFVVGDGAGAVVIKRLADAIASGDRIFAVVSGYGQASDGKGKAIAAPNDRWQTEVIRRAWQMANADADSIELIEAHGTSTQVGDFSEACALKNAFAAMGATRRAFCGIGSVKSNIGHLKSAAGIAGFIKAVMAVDRKILPPTAGFIKENPKLEFSNSPFYLLTEARAWTESSHPRRAGVSAFGFGGADYHIAIEEYREQDYAGATQQRRGRVNLDPGNSADAAPVASSAETLLLSAQTPNELLAQFKRFIAQFAGSNDDLLTATTRQNLQAKASDPVRLGLTCASKDELDQKLEFLGQWLGQEGAETALAAKGLYLGTKPALSTEQVAVMFPGQGSQYADMLAPLRARFAAAHQTFLRADAWWNEQAATSVSELIDSSLRGAKETDALLRKTENTHPTLVVSSLASFSVLREMGFCPRTMIGHSVGEFTALTAAKRLSFTDALALVLARARSFAEVPAGSTGAMLALPLAVDSTRTLLESLGSDLAIANVNSPTQTIVSGQQAAIEQLAGHCATRGVNAILLNVSHAFHSPLMAPAEMRFRQSLEQAEFRPSVVNVIANRTNLYFGESSQQVKDELWTQITGAVRFADSVRKLYADGIRLFVEVGPSAVLSQLVRNSLSADEVTVVASDSRRGDSLEAFQRLVCALFASGIALDPTCATRRETPRARESGSIVPPVLVRSKGVVDQSETLTVFPPLLPSSPVIVYSGVSLGLPGSFKESFRDDNFEQLVEGRNFIERLTDQERQQLVELQVTKVVKSEQGASFATLSSLNEVIQLAGKLGRLDLGRDYLIDDKDVANMSLAIGHAVAAGYEALRDAQIPLVHEYVRTAGGSMLPERWALPKEMQRHTGVIFANGFPMLEPIIREVSRHLSYRLGGRVREDLFEFYDSLIGKVTDREARKLLSDWFALNHRRLAPNPDEAQVYRFNHHLMTQLSMQANNRLARLINARGPNFQINAACSSTSTAITLAEDMIRGGRAKRVIVIGADDPTSALTLPYLGAGFLSTGACTNAGDLHEAALPFDQRRNGMIMGAGAVGVVVEADTECRHRGVAPLCELLGTHCFNTAGHQSQLDVPRYAEELEMFITRMEAAHGLSRGQLAPRLVYVSHETYTPARGGCSESEAVALKQVFGDDYRKIEISNTKGMTGHTMGASIEDAVAARALQFGKAPPVVNHRKLDPALEGLNLGTGASRHFEYALRMAAGFGSQGNYILLKQRAKGERRIEDAAVYAGWLATISGLERAELDHRGRLLVVRDTKPGSIVVDRPDGGSMRPSGRASISIAPNPVPSFSASSSTAPPRTGKPPMMSPGSMKTEDNRPAAAEAQALVLREVAALTGYSPEVLDWDMELEADLGIDTVKQATLLANLAGHIGQTDFEKLSLSEYPTLRALVELCKGSPGLGLAVKEATGLPSQPTPVLPPAKPDAACITSGVAAEVREVISAVTGYPQAIIGDDMELEADLGIDTVKQATILAMLGERLSMPKDDALRLSDFGTVAQLIRLFDAKAPAGQKPVPIAPIAALAQADTKTSSSVVAPVPVTDLKEIAAKIYEIVGSLTPYPSEMLEGDLTLEGDLGLGPDSLANLVGQLRQHFVLARDFDCYPGSTLAAVSQSIKCAMLGVVATRESAAPSLVSQSTLGRQTLALTPAPASNDPLTTVAGKRVWVWGQDETCLGLIEGWLRSRGAHTQTLMIGPNSESDRCTTAAQSFLAQGAPDILIDLTVSAENALPPDAPPDHFRTAITQPLEARFCLCKLLAERKALPHRILVATALDGSFALGSEASQNAASPLYGLYLGLYKSIRKEWTECRLSFIDLNPTAWNGNGSAALELLDCELSATGAGVEICYVGGVRQRVVAIDGSATWKEVPGVLEADDVVVATGGGAGITAKVVLELGRASASSFALLGRTLLLADARNLSLEDETSRRACKTEIQQRLQANGMRVTPALIEREFSRLERSAEILSTLTALRALGCKAEYFSTDICDSAEVEQVLAEVRSKFGPITTLIHGAGLEVSHRLEQKSLEEFRAVYQTKTLGAYHLQWFTRNDPLRRIVAMSSIASRYGNVAQSDYCAGNGFLDLLIRTERCSGIIAKSLLWSGWRDLGMAWRNSFVRQHADRLGLCLVAPETAAAAARVELSTAGGPREVVLHLGLGNLADADQVLAAVDRSPLIDWVETRDSLVRTAHRRFSVERDAFLDQHRFAGTPFMPGVGFMEMMAEAAELLGSRTEGSYVFTDLHFLEGFKLHREAPREVQLHIASDTDLSKHAMTVRSTFCPKPGLPVQQLDYAKAFVEIVPSSTTPNFAQDFLTGLSRETTYTRIYEDAATRQKNVAMGPLFNDARRMQTDSSRVRFGSEGIETWVPLPRAQLDHPGYPLNLYRINPAFLDALHQAGAVLAIQLTGHVYLPVGADEFTVFAAPKREGHYRVQARLLSLNDSSAIYDMRMMHEDGSSCAQIKGSRFRRITA